MKQIVYSEKARKQVREIAQGDKKSAALIFEKIEHYAEGSANADVKVLRGKYGEFKRLRAGNYRVIFDEDDRVLSVYSIHHRLGGLPMIAQNIILQDGKPVAVVVDYNEYMNLIERTQDMDDYADAVLQKQTSTTWIDHETLKKEHKI
jgi:mRNA-degrading endonuclease RelE of RelBE toxin-antitoxin system